MDRMIQPLEYRVLLSATAATLAADLAVVNSDAAVLKASLASLHAAEVSLHAPVVDEVKATQSKGQKAANGRLNAALNRADNTAAAKITAAELRLIAVAKAESATGVALGKSLLAHPTKTSIARSVAKTITALGTNPAAKLAALESTVTTTLASINGVYSEVAIEDPSAAPQIATGEAGVASAESNFGTTAAALVAATNQLATDLGTT